MFKSQVRTIEDAFVYVCDCNLATVADLAGKRSRGKHEYERQIQIAQTAINWMRSFGVRPSGRSSDVLQDFGGSVEKWASQWDVLSSDKSQAPA